MQQKFTSEEKSFDEEEFSFFSEPALECQRDEGKTNHELSFSSSSSSSSVL